MDTEQLGADRKRLMTCLESKRKERQGLELRLGEINRDLQAAGRRAEELLAVRDSAHRAVENNTAQPRKP